MKLNSRLLFNFVLSSLVLLSMSVVLLKTVQGVWLQQNRQGQVLSELISGGDYPGGTAREALESELREQQNQNQKKILFLKRIAWFFILSMFLMLVLTWIHLARSVQYSLEKLAKEAASLVNGQPGANVTVSAENEIGSIARAINKLAQDLKSSVENEKKLASIAADAESSRKRATKLNWALQRMEQLQSQLIQTGKLSAIGQLGAGVAHELNSPLAGILTLLRVYKTKSKEGTLEFEHFTEMLNATEHMAKVVRDLNYFSRESKDERAPLDFHDVINDTLSFGAPQLTHAQIKIKKEFAKTLPKIYGDKGQLQQVVLNVINNARDAMSEGGEFVIRTREEDQKVVIEFEDGGVGIDPKIISQIFDPFFTTKSSYRGTGLGLSISRDIVQKHEGKLSVESQVGKGTKFTLAFPSLSM